MSWWDPNSFSSFASQALKKAQMGIDKVLDIKEDEQDGNEADVSSASVVGASASGKTSKNSETSMSASGDNSFWSAYFESDALTGFTSFPSTLTPVTKPTARASTPSQGSRLGTGVPSQHASSELKTSATSAFSVRSKRVESTLLKYQVKSEVRVDNPKATDSKILRTTRHERQRSDQNLTTSEPTPITNVPVKNEITSPLKDNKSQVIVSTSTAGVQLEVETVTTVKENVSLKEDPVTDKNKDDPRAGVVSTESVTESADEKKSRPLRLGMRLSKKKEEQSARKSPEEEEAKEEAALIATQVEDLLLGEDPLCLKSKTVVTPTTGAQPPREVQADSDPQSPPGLITPLEPEPEGEGSGWEDEMVDVDLELDIGEESLCDKVEAPVPSVDNVESSSGGEDADIVHKTHVEVKEDSKSEIDNEVESEPPVEMEDNREEKSEDEEQNVVEKTDYLHDQGHTEVKSASLKEVAPVLELNHTKSELIDEAKVYETEFSEDVEVGKDETGEVFKEHGEDSEEEPAAVLAIDKLDISLESLGIAEGASDELSESSRTLTADDFKLSSQSPQEESKVEIREEVETQEESKVKMQEVGKTQEESKVKMQEEGETQEESKVKMQEVGKTQEEVEMREEAKVETQEEVEMREEAKVETQEEVEMREEAKVETQEEVEMREEAKVETRVEVEMQESSKVETQEEYKVETRQEAQGGEAAGVPESADIQKSAEAAMEVKKEGSGFLSSSSYVKTMLEEAMVESMKDTDSHSSSTSEKSSEMVRIESGMNSGHTSGDEIDTTTSSDIEIISTPTPNGDYRQERPFDLSPLRQALSRTVRRSPPGHKRSDSSSSGQSTWSKNGEDAVSPVGGMHHEQDVVEEETNEEEPDKLQVASETSRFSQQGTSKEDAEDQNDPFAKDKLLKTIMEITEPPETTTLPEVEEETEVLPPDGVCSLDQTNLGVLREEFGRDLDVSELLQKLADMAEVLEARERKLVEQSHENISLQESNAVLKNQLQQSEEAREAELEDLNTVTDEFTTRLSDFESKLHLSARERDTMRKQLQEAQTEMARKSTQSSGLERLVAEKDQQISELLEEGEKLSKQQLQSNNIIKKLRAKDKDNDALVKSQKQKLEQQQEELEHLRKVLDAKEDLEKRQIEAINQQNICINKQDSEMSKIRSDLEDTQENARGLEAALDNSYKEMAELHKAKAAAASETQVARLSVEMQTKQELQMVMDRQHLQHKQESEALITQIEDLQLSLTRQEREHGRREDVLRQEISDLQQRLQEAEERNQDLTQSVSVATRPLLRQIENLQSTHGAHASSYEKVEKNLTERLTDAQTALAGATEKERAASEQLMEVKVRVKTLETQLATVKQEKSRLAAQLDMEKTKCIVLEDTKNSETARLEAIKVTRENTIIELKKEKILLENQLEMEKMRVESEKKKLVLVHEQLRDKELQMMRLSATPSPRSCSREGSITGDSITPLAFSQEDVFEKTLMLTSANGSKANLYESLRQTGAATLIESLQSQLKMKEGEITQLQTEIAELEHTRESMARELVNLSTKNDELQEQLTEYPELKEAHQDLNSRYQALLQMYGEKVEEAEELNLDLQDVKDMYRGQIEELLKRR